VFQVAFLISTTEFEWQPIVKNRISYIKN